MTTQIRRASLLFSCCALLLATGCGGDENGNGFSQSTAGLIEVDPAELNRAVDIGLAEIGGTVEFPLRLRNVGNGPLEITAVTLFYSAPEGGDPQGAAYVLGGFDGPVTLDHEDGATLDLLLTFTRQEQFTGRVAVVRIESDSRDGLEQVEITFVAQAPQAVAVVQPAVVDFDTVPQGDVEERFVTVSSTGSDTLVCHAFALEGHPDFTFHHPQDASLSFPVSEVTASRVDLEPTIVIEPNATEQLRITFAPQTDTPATGSFQLFCNDPQLEGHTVVLLANNDVPCVAVTPSTVSFGGKIVGTKSELPVLIENCGAAPLEITDVRLENSDADFGLEVEFQIVEGAPLVVPVNESIDAKITYVPDVVSPLDADNQPVPDEGTLVVENNSFERTVEVPITGTGVESGCPIAIITVDEGEQVVPQTTLHLNGDQSYSPDGVPISNWEWNVTQPDGSTAIFIPSASHDNPVFTANVAGAYEFCLDVRNENGDWASDCDGNTCLTVIVIPDEAIHVELTWTTAGDPNVEDTGEGKGTDMDLHFAHPFATGPDIDGDGVGDPWFDDNYDAFWFYKTHNWGTFSPDVDDDPHLDLDDIDGWGPENLNLNIPEAVSYRIGVHYWNHHGMGESLASVRIWIYGELTEEVLDVPMQNLDMWNVGTIDWLESGVVQTTVLTDEAGDYLITPGYVNPSFLPPISNDPVTP